MKLKILLPILLVSIIMLGCKKEAAIEPDTLQPEYTLPQGNHDYDARIVNFQRKYGTYILYKFTEKDFRWNVNSEISFVADQGDQNNITPALDALDEYLFHYYSDDFLKKNLPYKIILSSRVRQLIASWDGSGADTVETPLSCVSNLSHITFGYANDQLATMTTDELKQMKAYLHGEFWRQAVVGKKIPIPPVFVSATPSYFIYEWELAENGVLDDPFRNYASDFSLEKDFTAYIRLIASTTPAELEQTLFLPENDPNGKYRLKYNAILNYYKQEYDIDLLTLTN